tara:strand:- start:713 stop:907 length:195 start_codon:yes stop_codon:yes gene_type:complete
MLKIEQQPGGMWTVKTAASSEPELFESFEDATAWVRRLRRELPDHLQKWALPLNQRKTRPRFAL